MTREEAAEKLTSLWYFLTNNDYPKKDLDALKVAIKALEQEPILDKIRAEIMDFEEELFHRPNTDYSDYSAVRYCVEIIDKYKAESEDKE
jgi:hypothetical protein